ncbi:hypothetical protein AC579_8379 [Pseudocercospora musae]|uniref:Uncharacterized protein n=1 Tax=Pseudocercospora musae TaxID=113226 RepID=A0A139II52_9PEZI|nr:hypothetical protein AC579_8379 [Pseudocercospora musae]
MHNAQYAQCTPHRRPLAHQTGDDRHHLLCSARKTSKEASGMGLGMGMDMGMGMGAVRCGAMRCDAARRRLQPGVHLGQLAE